jgi:hypothetical protein
MMTRYLSGLCVAGLGLCGGGWLVVAALAFGGESAGHARRINLLTGVALIAVCSVSLICWSVAWRQRMRADGVLVDRFPLVSRREARRNRRALSRDVRRAAKLAERSARGARRAARRSARLASGGALSEGGVLGEGVSLGVAAPGDEPYGAAASYSGGVTPSPVNGSAVNGSAVHGSPATGSAMDRAAATANGVSANGVSANGVSVSAAGANPGERAAELIGELRSMLEPLLAATGGQPALTDQLAALARRSSPTTPPTPPTIPDAPNAPTAPTAAAPTNRTTPTTPTTPTAAAPTNPAAPTAAAPSPLPQRSPFASPLRPRVTAADLAMPGARSAPMSIPRLAQGVGDSSQGPASDGEDAWW